MSKNEENFEKLLDDLRDDLDQLIAESAKARPKKSSLKNPNHKREDPNHKREDPNHKREDPNPKDEKEIKIKWGMAEIQDKDTKEIEKTDIVDHDRPNHYEPRVLTAEEKANINSFAEYNDDNEVNDKNGNKVEKREFELPEGYVNGGNVINNDRKAIKDFLFKKFEENVVKTNKKYIVTTKEAYDDMKKKNILNEDKEYVFMEDDKYFAVTHDSFKKTIFKLKSTYTEIYDILEVNFKINKYFSAKDTTPEEKSEPSFIEFVESHCKDITDFLRKFTINSEVIKPEQRGELLELLTKKITDPELLKLFTENTKDPEVSKLFSDIIKERESIETNSNMQVDNTGKELGGAQDDTKQEKSRNFVTKNLSRAKDKISNLFGRISDKLSPSEAEKVTEIKEGLKKRDRVSAQARNIKNQVKGVFGRGRE